MMIRTLAIMIALIALFALYKMQHVKPVDDPKDSPIFQQRLQSSLDRFQENEFPAGPENMQARQRPGTKPPTPRPPARTRELTVTGKCGNITLTWVEEKRINKETISIKRLVQGEKDSLLPGNGIYEREEEGGGVRYWASDKGLSDGVKYEYLISFKGPQGKEVVKKPVSLNLTCTEQDREIIAQREKMIKEYYKKRGVKPQSYDAVKPSSYQLGSETHQINPGKSPRKGSENAPVTLVVFTDFECIYCSTWAETLETMLETFPDDIKIVFKNYPLAYHKQAELAATAALAAGEQGKFWDMHDLLYKNRNALKREDLLSYAKQLKLDHSQFEKSLESTEIKKQLLQDKTQGQTLGVRNIPTTFINGRSLSGSPPPSYIKGVIEEMLGKE